MEAMGLPELATSSKYSSMALRAEYGNEIVNFMDQKFAEKTAEEWDETFRLFQTDFIYSIVQSVQDLPNDPQVTENNYIVDFEHPVLGNVQMCNHPNIYSETPAGIWKEAPEVGQDTESILIEDLKYSWDDIGKLQDLGVIL